MTNFAWYAFIITQIIAESLPISSSGHVALVGIILGFSLYDFMPNRALSDSWLTQELKARSIDHFMHGPTFLIITFFFYSRWTALLKYWRRTLPMLAKLVVCVGIADSITACFFVARRYMALSNFPLGAGFIVTGLVLASLAWCNRRGGSLNVNNAIILGLVQGCAMLPGVSRLATTYTAARWLSFSDRHALEVAWMIQAPLIGISFLHSLIIFEQNGIPDQILNPQTALVMMGAGIGGWYGLQLVAYLGNRKKMWWFACYMVIPIIAWLIYR